MNIAPAVFDLLRNDSTIAGIVQGRIYPDQVPQNVPYPAIVHYKEDVERTAIKNAPTINYKVRYKVEVYSEKYGDGEVLAQAIEDVLADYSGTVKGINIQRCYYVNKTDDAYIEDLGAHTVQVSFLFRVVV